MFLWGLTHQPNPNQETDAMLETYTCWSDDPDDTEDYEVFDAESAAEMYAEFKFQQDFDVAFVQALDIHVTSPHQVERSFTIEIQMEPRFYATEVYD
jgi:hypothetical protein